MKNCQISQWTHATHTRFHFINKLNGFVYFFLSFNLGRNSNSKFYYFANSNWNIYLLIYIFPGHLWKSPDILHFKKKTKYHQHTHTKSRACMNMQIYIEHDQKKKKKSSNFAHVPKQQINNPKNIQTHTHPPTHTHHTYIYMQKRHEP